jgi:hypothetical protein
MESQTIQITFINEKFKRYPKVKIFIDGDLLEEKEFTAEKETVKIPIDLLDGKHKLEIEHFDKTNSDTEFKNNSILRDTKFKIENINICSYDIPYTFILKSQFRPDWSKLTKPKDFPDLLKQSLIVGPNGIWSLFFETPVDDWLINERKKATLNKLEKTVTYDSYEPSEDSIIDYQLTDFDRQLMKEIKELIK